MAGELILIVEDNEKNRRLVRDVLQRATLTLPHDVPRLANARGGRAGAHTEFLGHMLAEMQIIARSHPGATW